MKKIGIKKPSTGFKFPSFSSRLKRPGGKAAGGEVTEADKKADAAKHKYQLDKSKEIEEPDFNALRKIQNKPSQYKAGGKVAMNKPKKMARGGGTPEILGREADAMTDMMFPKARADSSSPAGISHTITAVRPKPKKSGSSKGRSEADRLMDMYNRKGGVTQAQIEKIRDLSNANDALSGSDTTDLKKGGAVKKMAIGGRPSVADMRQVMQSRAASRAPMAVPPGLAKVSGPNGGNASGLTPRVSTPPDLTNRSKRVPGLSGLPARRDVTVTRPTSPLVNRPMKKGGKVKMRGGGLATKGMGKGRMC